ncbi:hypothetical protein [Streptosporangium sp. OZ121]|uniref:hypothetical protein n=1 Tax=Streptosporangium sp. OZ121 TaxID=3444183 RepID=UPI003F7A3EC3
MITREIQLAAQIAGAPALAHFTVATTEVDGEVLVRTDRAALEQEAERLLPFVGGENVSCGSPIAIGPS